MITPLRNIEKISIASAIQQKGLELINFKPEDGNFQYKLSFLDSGLFFIWKMHPDIWDNFTHSYSKYTPQRSVIKSREGNWLTMHDAMGVFDKWLSTEVKMFDAEKLTPDPWAIFQNEHPEINSIIPNIERNPFSPEEQSDLETRLTQLSDQLERVLALNTTQAQHLRSEVKYLINESKSQSKFNWVGISISVIFGLQSFFDIHPNQIMQLWDMFNQTLRSLPSLTGFNPQLLTGD